MDSRNYLGVKMRLFKRKKKEPAKYECVGYEVRVKMVSGALFVSETMTETEAGELRYRLVSNDGPWATAQEFGNLTLSLKHVESFKIHPVIKPRMLPPK